MDVLEQFLSEAIEIGQNHASTRDKIFINWRARTEQFFYNTYGSNSYEYLTFHDLAFQSRIGITGDASSAIMNAQAFERDMEIAIGLIKGRKNETVKESTGDRTEIFISHRSTDASVAEMIKDFLVATGIPNEKIFCSSLPGNDVNEKISPEVKTHLQNAAINILILSKAYFESAFCLNEAGVIWYLDDALAVPVGLPEISQGNMVGFLNSDYKLRRLDNENDVSYLYDKAKDRIGGKETKVSVAIRETQKLKDRYQSFLRTRKSETEEHAELVDVQHLIEIKAKIEAVIVDKSWAKTQADSLKLLRDRPSQFRCNNLILRDPAIPVPDVNNGLIKVEPYDFSDDGIIVIVPRGNMRKRIKVKGRGEIEVDVFSEILFRDIEEIDPKGSQNYPYPTLFCRFHGKNPFNRDVYIDVEMGHVIDQDKIEA